MNLQDEQEKLQSRNFKKFGLDMNIFVSLVTAVLVLGFIIFTTGMPETATRILDKITLFLNTNFNWLYIMTLNAAVFFILFLGFSKYGKIRLGGYTSTPDFSDASWYAMMFSAGVGIGIFFYGVAEPIYHFSLPEGLQTGSEFDNFKVMFLNWGFHAWAIYGMLAIALGYFSYNKGLPFAMRSLFYPILKEKIYGTWGDIIDTIATLAVLFGLATSLGLGAQQINAGLNYLFGIDISSSFQILLIIGITLIATMSVVSGLSKGVKLLSELNLVLSGLLLLAITLIGPTTRILSTYLSSVGLYLSEFFTTGLYTATSEADMLWQGSWTIFYAAWWIAWAPFVGTFIARISRGRTIREVAFGVLFVPSIAITLAMTILGTAGIHVNEMVPGIIEAAIENDVSTSMFEMFKYLTDSGLIQGILSVSAVFAILVFFVTSSDSGSLVVSSLTSGGIENPPKAQKIFWAFAEGGIAIAVLIAGGEAALETIQGAVILLGFPFSIILLMVMGSMIAELNVSYKTYNFNKDVTLKRKLKAIDLDTEYIETDTESLDPEYASVDKELEEDDNYNIDGDQD